MKATGILVLSILVVLCFGLLWAYNGPAKNISEPQDQKQDLVTALNTANHEIEAGESVRLISNLKNNIQVKLLSTKGAKGTRGGVFAASAIKKLVSQPGIVGVRYYYAQKDDGTPTIILVGVNERGLDMATLNLERAIECPPFCGN